MSKLLVGVVLALCVLCVLKAVAEDDGMQGGYGDMGGAGYGESLQDQLLGQMQGQLDKPLCPPGQTPVMKKDYQVFSNSSNADSLRKHQPEYAGALADCFTYGYNICSQMCGYKMPKCEDYTKECTEKACKEHDDPKECTTKGKTEVGNKKLFGRIQWPQQQTTACDCVDKGDELQERRQEELEEFYQKWAPDQSSKVAGLLKKYRKSWPQLMLALHAKYRESVKVVQNEEEEEEDKDKDKDKVEDKAEEKEESKPDEEPKEGDHVEL